MVEELEVVEVCDGILGFNKMLSLLHINLIKTLNGLLLQLFLVESIGLIFVVAYFFYLLVTYDQVVQMDYVEDLVYQI